MNASPRRSTIPKGAVGRLPGSWRSGEKARDSTSRASIPPFKFKVGVDAQSPPTNANSI